MERRTKLKRATVSGKATTHEVIGNLEQSLQINPKWRPHYQRLVDLHSYLLNRKDNLVRDVKEQKPAFSLHMADAGTDNYDQDFALSIISSEQDALYEIEQAIKRIKDETYGFAN
jgi:DnaK suppressor protein